MTKLLKGCQYCGKAFETKHANQLYCDRFCRDGATRQREKERSAKALARARAIGID